jgi:hypothetical protein
MFYIGLGPSWARGDYVCFFCGLGLVHASFRARRIRSRSYC